MRGNVDLGFKSLKERQRSIRVGFPEVLGLRVHRAISWLGRAEQLVGGGTTWNSGVNRRQVTDGAAVIGTLMPVFIDIMMDNQTHDWGTPFYPVVK